MPVTLPCTVIGGSLSVEVPTKENGVKMSSTTVPASFGSMATVEPVANMTVSVGDNGTAAPVDAPASRIGATEKPTGRRFMAISIDYGCSIVNEQQALSIHHIEDVAGCLISFSPWQLPQEPTR